MNSRDFLKDRAETCYGATPVSAHLRDGRLQKASPPPETIRYLVRFKQYQHTLFE